MQHQLKCGAREGSRRSRPRALPRHLRRPRFTCCQAGTHDGAGQSCSHDLPALQAARTAHSAGLILWADCCTRGRLTAHLWLLLFYDIASGSSVRERNQDEMEL